MLFLSKTFGDAMEIDLATGVIRNLTAHFPHFGFTRALYLSNGHILLSGPTEFNPANVGAARTNCWLFVLDPSGTARPQPLGVKAAEGPVPSRKRMHIAWSYRAAQFPGGEMPPGSSQMHEGDIVYENGAPKLINQRKILDSRDLPFSATLEPQNYRPTLERELIFSAYDYQQSEVFGVDLTTGKLTNYSNGPGVYDEPEGIFPSGEFTTVESDKHNPAGKGFDRADIHKLRLDGSGAMERLTFFADVPTYRSSNPVVSDDGRYMAFQMGRSGVAAGIGYGLFLYDFTKAPVEPRAIVRRHPSRKRARRIELRRPARGKEARQSGARAEHECDRAERHGIEQRHAEELSLDERARGRARRPGPPRRRPLTARAPGRRSCAAHRPEARRAPCEC